MHFNYPGRDMYQMRYPLRDSADDRMQRTMNPQSPLPQGDMEEALRAIADAVSGEAEDRAFYEYLIGQAPSNEDKNIIAGIRNDEMRHYDMFRQLYYELTGQTLPQVQGAPFERPASYCEGLRRALMGEQNAVAKYRNILFAMQQRRHINAVTMIITDELRHLGLYNYLYAKNNCGANT